MNTKYLRSAAIPLLVITIIAFFLISGRSNTTPKNQGFPQLYAQIDKDEIKTIEVRPGQNKLVIIPTTDSKIKRYELGYGSDEDLKEVKDRRERHHWQARKRNIGQPGNRRHKAMKTKMIGKAGNWRQGQQILRQTPSFSNHLGEQCVVITITAWCDDRAVQSPQIQANRGQQN